MKIPFDASVIKLKGKYIPWSYEQDYTNDKYLFAVQCPWCKVKRTVPINGQQLYYWHKDMDHDLTQSETEALKTGICDPCWERVFD